MQPQVERVAQYYTEAGPDYSEWSKSFNMHFGFHLPGMSPFDREAMLVQMNKEVLRRLEVDVSRPLTLLDMGSGLGATAFFAARRWPHLQIHGVTAVPAQATAAERAAHEQDLAGRVQFSVQDYTSTSFPDASFDGVYALESSCYADGLAKAPLLREIARVLKPGGRVAIADALLRDQHPMGPVTAWSYRSLCKGWELETLGEVGAFTAEMNRLGFRNVTVEDISRNVIPSLLHAPLVATRFLVRQALRANRALTPRRLGNALVGFTAPLFVLSRRSGYFLLSAQKPS